MQDVIEQYNKYNLTPTEQEHVVAVTYLANLANKIGINEGTLLEGNVRNSSRINIHILKYAFEIYKVWASLFPKEKADFITSMQHELDVERPVKQAIKAGGYSPIAFPTRLDRLFNLMMPSVKTQDRRFWQPLLTYIPELRRSNYV